MTASFPFVLVKKKDSKYSGKPGYKITLKK